MFALLLTAAATSPFAQALIPKVEVSFPGGQSVSVQGPEPMGDFQAKTTQTLLSPRGDAAAVRFCWDVPKYDSCQVRLARPDGTVQVLKNSNVTKLLWTADGKYLIGAGVNALRLWNLVGSVRTVVPQTALNEPRHRTQITRLWLRDRDLCVSMLTTVFGGSGQRAGQLMTTTRYALPVLKPLEIVTLPARAGQEAPCHTPHTEP